MQVDKGAIKFLLSGANVMCPGLTSPGARMTDVQSETVVVSFDYLHIRLVIFSVLFIHSRKVYIASLYKTDKNYFLKPIPV